MLMELLMKLAVTDVMNRTRPSLTILQNVLASYLVSTVYKPLKGGHPQLGCLGSSFILKKGKRLVTPHVFSLVPFNF